MNRRNLITALFAGLFLLQAVLLASWHIASAEPLRPVDVAVSIVTLAVTGIVYLFSARLYRQAIKRSTETHVAQASEDLERSLKLYRDMAAREEALTRKVCDAIETELNLAREDLAQGKLTEVDSHLQHSLDMATEALPTRCHNTTVAAVLEAESRQCANEGVILEAKADVPAIVGLSDIEMAALFFSLIDDALGSCRELREDDPATEPTISVRALTDAGQLLIEVDAPRAGSGGKKRRGTSARSANGKTDWNARVVEDFVKSNNGLIERTEESYLTRTSVMIPLQAA